MNEKLLSCPFCGGEAKMRKSKQDILGRMKDCYNVFCTECCCETQFSASEIDAAHDWNKRTCSCKKQEG